MAEGASIHASSVLIGARAVLIRGESGTGKSSLAFSLLQAACTGLLPFARLVSDDRTLIEVAAGRLLARPPQELAGLLELRGLGLRKLAFEPLAVVGWAVDLAAPDAQRLPAARDMQCEIGGVALPRLAVAAGEAHLPRVLEFCRTA